MYRTVTSQLMQRWHRQIGTRRSHGHESFVRNTGAINFRIAGTVIDGFARLEQLSVLTVFDEQRIDGQCAIGVCGYKPRNIPHGIEWGGNDSCFLFKDLALRPASNACGRRLDSDKSELLRCVLELDARICTAERNRRIPRFGKIRLPKLWAGFHPQQAATIRGEGPEFDAICDRFRMEPTRMFQLFERPHCGLLAYPLDWVSVQLHFASTVFVELEGFPRRQLFRLRDPIKDLAGFAGAATYDFYSSQFRAAGRGNVAHASRPQLLAN